MTESAARPVERCLACEADRGRHEASIRGRPAEAGWFCCGRSYKDVTPTEPRFNPETAGLGLIVGRCGLILWQFADLIKQRSQDYRHD